MSPEAVPRTILATKPCMRCRVQINAASGYCTLCGTVQRVPRRMTRWLTGTATVLIVVIAVLAAALSGGSAEAPFRLYQSGGVATLVPVGWKGGSVAAAPGVTRLEFADPAHQGRRLTVVANRSLRLTAGRRALLVRTQVRTPRGYRERRFGRVAFRDGRPAWLLSYDSAGITHAVYVFSACVPMVSITVVLRVPLPYTLPGRLAELPASVKARC